MDGFNPFALPDDLWALPESELLDQAPAVSLFQGDLEKLLQLGTPFETAITSEPETLFPTQPWGEKFPLKEILKPEPSTKASEPVEASDNDSGIGAGEDLWLEMLSHEPEDLKTGKLISWETFLSQGAHRQSNSFITESNSYVLDAVIQRYEDAGRAIEPKKNILQTDVLIYCILHLIQGRDSLLFRFNPQARMFEMTRQDLRLSGTTTGLTTRVISKFQRCGNQLKYLQAFIASVYDESKRACKSRVALAHCVEIVTVAIQHRLTVVFTSIQSILQLEDIVKVPTLIFDALLRIVVKVMNQKADHQLLSAAFEQIQQLEYRSDWLRRLLLLMLQRISQPWLTMISKSIGITKEKSTLGEAIFHEDGFFIEWAESIPQRGEDQSMDLIFIPGNLPRFLMLEEAERIFETARGLKLMKRFYPDHPLLSEQEVFAKAVQWKFSWDDIQAIDLEAASHERRMQFAMKMFGLHKAKPLFTFPLPPAPMKHDFDLDFDCYGKTAEEIQSSLRTSLQTMSVAPRRKFGFGTDAEDELGNEALSVLQDATTDLSSKYPPPLSITFSLSLNPILQAQARLANMASMRLLFKERDIKKQFRILHNFALFGDGVYVARLSTALFSGDLASGKTNSGIRQGIAIGGWGLQLGVREDWPPASSELRLALMNIMSDCYISGVGRNSGHKESDELPGGLSFTVREMSEEEEDLCKNPDGLEALDFLQVKYKPESPYDLVIDHSSLTKYDRLFKHLLRMIRLLFVVNQMFAYTNINRDKTRVINPTIQRFRVEAHFFISTLAKYMFEAGIESIWKEFAKKLDEIEDRLERYEISDKYGEMESLGQLAAYHNSCLDQMLFATMQRQRLAPVLKVIEEIFVFILKFSKIIRLQVSGTVDSSTPTDDGTILKLYLKFRKRVGIFIAVARSLSERRGYGGLATREPEKKTNLRAPVDTEEGGTLGQLLVKLEMSSYWADISKEKEK